MLTFIFGFVCGIVVLIALSAVIVGGDADDDWME